MVTRYIQRLKSLNICPRWENCSREKALLFSSLQSAFLKRSENGCRCGVCGLSRGKRPLDHGNIVPSSGKYPRGRVNVNLKGSATNFCATTPVLPLGTDTGRKATISTVPIAVAIRANGRTNMKSPIIAPAAGAGALSGGAPISSWPRALRTGVIRRTNNNQHVISRFITFLPLDVLRRTCTWTLLLSYNISQPERKYSRREHLSILGARVHGRRVEREYRGLGRGLRR